MRNAYHAMSHPCYSFPGYKCVCGHFSKNSKLHVEHVTSEHADNDEIYLQTLSSRQYDRVKGIKRSGRKLQPLIQIF